MSFHLTVADNLNSLRAWHEKKHLLSWADCPTEPCVCLEPEFRRCWQENR